MTEHANGVAHLAGSHGFLSEIVGYSMILRRRWPIVAVSVLVCLTFAILYLAKAHRYYQASTRVLILQQGGRPLNVGSNDPVQLNGNTDDLLATHGMIVSSPVVVGRAIEAVGLQNLPSLAGVENPVKEAIDLLKVGRPDRMARILEISYQAFSREEAVQMVEAVTKSYRTFLDDTYQKSTGEVISLIAHARDDLGKELDQLREEYLQVREKSNVPVLDRMGESYLSHRLEQWDRAVTDMTIKGIVLRAQLELGKKLAAGNTELWAIAHAITQLGGDASSLTATLSARTTLTGATDYVRQLEQEQQQLTERHGPQFSKVQELQEQVLRVKERVRSLRSRMEDSEVKDLLGSLEQSLKSSETMHLELAAGFERDRKEVKGMELDLLKEESLRDKLERKRTLFNTVVDQLKQAQYVSDFTTISSEIIEPANALSYPVRPRIVLTLAVALLLGSMLGGGIATVVDRLDQRIRSIDELRRVFELPILGNVPHVSPSQAPAIGSLGMISQSLPKSTWAEAYRGIRTNLEFLRRGRTIQVILVTSPHAGDGKSTTASNIAISLARLGRKVLLVDGDLRKPSQDRIHGIARTRGITTVLRGLVPARRVVERTSVENLDLITVGPQVANPSELLMSAGMKEFLDDVRREYDLVIIDSSPILAVTDPAIIAAGADGIVLVVSTANLRHRDATRTVESLKAIGTSVLGVVVNGNRSDRDEYGYGSGYGTESEPAGSDQDQTEGDAVAAECGDQSVPSHTENGRADSEGTSQGHD